MWSAFKLGEIREFETILESPQDATVLKEIIQTYKTETESRRISGESRLVAG